MEELVYQELVANASGPVQRVKWLGRQHLVAPMTIIVPGVLPGSKGRGYYPPEEVSTNVHTWNMMPLVLNHPVMDGKSVSGRRPDVFEQYGMGFAFNALYEGKLMVYGWFDDEQTKRVDERVHYSLENNLRLELSTGLFTRNQLTKGVDPKGAPYDFIVRGMQPDHIAILPDAKGACSVVDGCGVLNAFCPTGSGGGQDNSCSAGGGGGAYDSPRTAGEANFREADRRLEADGTIDSVTAFQRQEVAEIYLHISSSATVTGSFLENDFLDVEIEAPRTSIKRLKKQMEERGHEVEVTVDRPEIAVIRIHKESPSTRIAKHEPRGIDWRPAGTIPEDFYANRNSPVILLPQLEVM